MLTTRAGGHTHRGKGKDEGIKKEEKVQNLILHFVSVVFHMLLLQCCFFLHLSSLLILTLLSISCPFYKAGYHLIK